MNKKLLITFFLFIYLFNNHCLSANKDTLKWSVSIGYGIELSDSYMGHNGSSKIPDFASYYSAKLSVQKKWYGANAYFGILKNTYTVKHYDYIYEFKIPDMVEGYIAGINAAIYPVMNKYIEVEFDLGLNYININNLMCYSWSYQVSDGKLLDARYDLVKESGFGLNYGMALKFPIYKRLKVNTFIKFPKTENSTLFLAGIGVTYNLN
ncbi:hypothetical protein CYCD_16280 [Tenuifilaceae bacterium CYCD]|nr:hypothetical protein CYCD_16280 [Tenuifilaceae bacterium CYCD]